jgi:hypothetical protein
MGPTWERLSSYGLTLTAGVCCAIELHIPRKTASLLIPTDAIIFNHDGLLENGVAHIRKMSVARDYAVLSTNQMQHTGRRTPSLN